MWLACKLFCMTMNTEEEKYLLVPEWCAGSANAIVPSNARPACTGLPTCSTSSTTSQQCNIINDENIVFLLVWGPDGILLLSYYPRAWFCEYVAFQYLAPIGVPAEFCHTLKPVTAGRWVIIIIVCKHGLPAVIQTWQSILHLATPTFAWNHACWNQKVICKYAMASVSVNVKPCMHTT